MRYNERDINSRNNDKKIAIFKLLSKLDMKFIKFFHPEKNFSKNDLIMRCLLHHTVWVVCKNELNGPFIFSVDFRISIPWFQAVSKFLSHFSIRGNTDDILFLILLALYGFSVHKFGIQPGMGKGQNGTVPRFFVPVPLVPQTSIPVPVPRDAKSVGTDRDLRPARQSRKSRHILVE